MSKGSSRPTVSTQTTTIPQYLQDAQQQVFDSANSFDPQLYTGERYAPENPYETQTMESLYNFGNQPGLAPEIENTISGLLGGNVGNSDMLREQYGRDMSSQYFDQMINDRIAQQTNDITSQYAQGGRLGSDAFGNALGQGIGSSIAPLLADNEYKDAQRQMQLAGAISDTDRMAAGLQLQAAGVAPTAQQMYMQQIAAMEQAGNQQRSLDMMPIAAQQSLLSDQNAIETAKLNALLSAAGVGNVPTTETVTGQEGREQMGLGSSLLNSAVLAKSFGLF
jgi:hypothetical protein